MTIYTAISLTYWVKHKPVIKILGHFNDPEIALQKIREQLSIDLRDSFWDIDEHKMEELKIKGLIDTENNPIQSKESELIKHFFDDTDYSKDYQILKFE